MSEQISDTTTGGNEEDLSKYQSDEGFALRWLKEIELVKNSQAQQAYESIGEKIVKTYRAGECLTSGASNLSKSMFNVLWSNIQVLRPSLFSRLPKVVVERMFKDSDPIGRLAALGAERATTFVLQSEQDRTKHAIKSAVEDRLLPGRGQVWVRYECEYENQQNEKGEAEEVVKANSERICVDYVFWQDYLEAAARNSYEVRWRARRVYMTRSKLIEKFGEEIGRAVTLQKDKKKSKEEVEFFAEAEVWEIEDSDTKTRIWVTDGHRQGALKVAPDVLKLKDFFCSPYPLLATTTTDSTYPTPDYKIYERLATELDYVTKRIQGLVECIRVVGACAEQFYTDLKALTKKSDGEVVSVKGWSAMMEKGGLAGVIDWLPLEQAVKALGPLVDYQQQLIAIINMITGIPDIAQGSTDPNETADAQQRKSHWAVVKLSDKQADVQRFCREVVAKIAELIFEPGLFSDETIYLMVGVGQMSEEKQAQWPEALALLRDDRLRTFRVSIETDSTIAIDEETDKQSRMEYMSAVNQLISNVQQISQFRPELMNPVIESALFVIRGFRTGRPLEGAWEQAMQKIEDNDKAAAEQAAQQPPPPDYEQMKAQAEMSKVEVSQQELQFKADSFAQEMQLKGQVAQSDFEIASRELEVKIMALQQDGQTALMAQELDAFRTKFDQAIETQRLELEKLTAVLDQKEKFMEEARLKHDQSIETARLVVDAKEVAQGAQA